MAKQRRGGPKARKIAAALREKLGIENVDVWYEPINGPCMEMQGYAGGWYYADLDELDGQPVDFGEPLGYNVAEALTMVDLSAKLRQTRKGET